jgi:hypothetical protein
MMSLDLSKDHALKKIMDNLNWSSEDTNIFYLLYRPKYAFHPCNYGPFEISSLNLLILPFCPQENYGQLELVK